MSAGLGLGVGVARRGPGVALRSVLLASSALIVAAALPATAQDAAWKDTPPTNDFNDGSNWSTGTTPIGNASFGASSRTTLNLSAATSLDTLTFNSGAPAYTINTGNFNFFTLSGDGIVNTSSNAPTINSTLSILTFDNSASASNANINTISGLTTFTATSTAGNATVTTTSGGATQFVSNGDGGNAQFVTNTGGTVDFSGTAGVNNDNKVHAGSIAGDTTGTYFLGANQLIVGTNNLSTIVAGTINDGGGFGGAGGAIQKVGTGTLMLSGANTYSGGTTVTAGVVEAAHATAGTIDALGTGAITIDGGTLRTTVDGALSNDLTFAANKTSTLSAATGTTLTLGSGGTGAFTTGTDAVATFGSSSDTGTITFGGYNTGAISVDATSRIVIAGGTLKDTGDQLAFLTFSAASTTVNAGATLDFNDSSIQIINNLNGAGTVRTGTGSGGNPLILLANPGDTNTFSGSIVGSHGVQINGGTMIFSGDNTYTGGTVICSCSTLVLGDGGSSGSVIGDIANGGLLAFNRSDNYVFAGKITDDAFDQGAVVQVGSGTTILTADNTYTGGTTVNSGKLLIGNGATSGSIFGGVTVNAGGTFGVNRSDTYVLPNTINGAGNFEQLGTGTTVFSSAQRYTGTTTITNGTLQIGNGGTAGSIASTDIVDNGTLAINKSNSFSLGATISGTGGLNQIGSGTTTLNAATTYSGATNITAGILRGGAANVFSANSAFNVGDDGTLNLSGFDQSIGSLAGSGAVTLATATLITGGDDTSTTFSGTIDGAGGVTKTGTGNFTYSGISAYTGATTVNGGTLSINGSIAASSGVTVNAGGTLGGTGTVSTTTINAGGALAPGNSIGTLTVNGNLTFNSGSSYNIEVSPSAADRTNVTGNATLNGATVNASFTYGSYIAKQYTILNATGGVSGTFGTLTSTNLPTNFTANLTYDTNNAYLNLVFGLSTLGGLSANQQDVANALTNYFNTNGGIPAAFGTLTSNGLTQTSGEPGASIPTAGFAAMNQFINVMFDNSNGDNSQGGPLGFAQENGQDNAYAPKRKLSPRQANAYAAVTPRDRIAAPFASRWNVWAAGYGGNSTTKGDATTGSQNTSTRVYGTAVGADYRATPDTRFGFAAGGAGTSFSLDGGLGGGRADVFQAGAYARHNIGAAYVTGALAYGWQDVTTDRTVTVSGTDKLRAEMKASSLAARLEGGWRYAMPAVAVTPYAAAQSTAFYLPSYAETATSGSNQFALSYASKTVTATRSELGARFDKTMPLAVPLKDTLLTLRARTAWAHDWNDNRSATATFQSLPGATFVVNGAQPAANAALLSAGADIAWGNGWTVAANFDGEFSRTTQGYAGRGSLKYAW